MAKEPNNIIKHIGIYYKIQGTRDADLISAFDDPARIVTDGKERYVAVLDADPEIYSIVRQGDGMLEKTTTIKKVIDKNLASRIIDMMEEE